MTVFVRRRNSTLGPTPCVQQEKSKRTKDEAAASNAIPPGQLALPPALDSASSPAGAPSGVPVVPPAQIAAPAGPPPGGAVGEPQGQAAAAAPQATVVVARKCPGCEYLLTHRSGGPGHLWDTYPEVCKRDPRYRRGPYKK